MNVLVQPRNDLSDPIAMLVSFFSPPFGQHLEQHLGSMPVKFHGTELVCAEQIDTAVGSRLSWRERGRPPPRPVRSRV